MYALINGLDSDEERVTISSSMGKLEAMAMKIINDYINDWEGFNAFEEAKLMRETLAAGDVDDSIELFNIITDKYAECAFIRISPADIIIDA